VRKWEGAIVNLSSVGSSPAWASLQKELSELISRLRCVAEAMRRLSSDQAGFREKLQELKDEVNTVCSRLRRVS
jgi:hypothetical protein